MYYFEKNIEFYSVNNKGLLIYLPGSMNISVVNSPLFSIFTSKKTFKENIKTKYSAIYIHMFSDGFWNDGFEVCKKIAKTLQLGVDQIFCTCVNDINDNFSNSFKKDGSFCFTKINFETFVNLFSNGNIDSKVVRELTHINDVPVTIAGVTRGTNINSSDITTFLFTDAKLSDLSIKPIVKNIASNSLRSIYLNNNYSFNNSLFLISSSQVVSKKKISYSEKQFSHFTNIMEKVLHRLSMLILKDGLQNKKIIEFKINTSFPKKVVKLISDNLVKSDSIKCDITRTYSVHNLTFLVLSVLDIIKQSLDFFNMDLSNVLENVCIEINGIKLFSNKKFCINKTILDSIKNASNQISLNIDVALGKRNKIYTFYTTWG